MVMSQREQWIDTLPEREISTHCILTRGASDIIHFDNGTIRRLIVIC